MEAHMDPLTHAHILLGTEQKRQLRFWAADRNTSMALLIREAIDYYLRVAVGPSPQKIRRAARDAAGCLPQGPSAGPQSGASRAEPWRPSED